MVKIKDQPFFYNTEVLDLNNWYKHLFSKGYAKDISLLQAASNLSQLYGKDCATEVGISCFYQGLTMADILADMQVDQPTLAAALLFDCAHHGELTIDEISQTLGLETAKLVSGVLKMNAIESRDIFASKNNFHIDNIRKMLLAMVDDYRVVLIKLAQKLCILRNLKPLPKVMQQYAAKEVMSIYAPLANRLGIGAIKWELEDLSFRYLEPEKYKDIAQGLKAKRVERDKFVNDIVAQFNETLYNLNIINTSVYGRSKHIHSIYRKMLRKNIPLSEIYDATAIRVLVETTDLCYEVLSLVHNKWQQILEEFDDYIVNPKPNGYQSLHSAVKTADNKVFEVQIRTFAMHELAEMGVAAHWKYKEGQKAVHERKISWLREVLLWHKEMAAEIPDNLQPNYIEDRVYVFTPQGDVVDLPKNATPLDFAYHIHSQVGHRCRGAKINEAIVPLTYKLKTGDRVEVLTRSYEQPSLDWLNYLVTPKAKAKINHWFKLQDFDKNLAMGQEMLNKDLKQHKIQNFKIENLLEKFNFNKTDDLYAAIGRGDVKTIQLINKIIPEKKEEDSLNINNIPQKITNQDKLYVDGLEHVVTNIAKCCQPLPGEDVIGFITISRGISVHKKDCSHIINASDMQKDRLLEVQWGKKLSDTYKVELVIVGVNNDNLLKKVISYLNSEKVNVFNLHTQQKLASLQINLMIEVQRSEQLNIILQNIIALPEVDKVYRSLD